MAAFGTGNRNFLGWTWLWTTFWAVLMAGCIQAPLAPIPVTTTPRPLLTQLLKTEWVSPTSRASPPTMTPLMTPTDTFLPPVQTPSLVQAPTMTPPSQEGVPATVSIEVLDVWDEPAHEKDYWSRQTQLILGERVLILAEIGDWARIVAVEQPSHKGLRGYPGWVRRGSVVNGWSQADKVAVVMVMGAQGRSQPDRQAGVVQPLPFDARLAVNEIRTEWVQVILPDHRMAWLPLQDCRLTNLLQDQPSLDQFYATAQTFLDIPYLWGGTANGALDCSGFVYRLYHAYGITLPRDANDQALSGGEVQGGAVKRGDLIFTSDKKGGSVTHVVMVWGSGLVIDEDSPKGLTIHPLGEVLNSRYQVSVRRYLP